MKASRLQDVARRAGPWGNSETHRSKREPVETVTKLSWSRLNEVRITDKPVHGHSELKVLCPREIEPQIVSHDQRIGMMMERDNPWRDLVRDGDW
jgi:hypothetical protein